MALNNELADLFASFAALMQIKGENPFKAIAFSKVSRVLNELTIDLREAVENNTLKDLEGIGKSSQRIIEQYVREGKSDEFQDIMSNTPPGLLELLRIPGMGPKTVSQLWKERGIDSVEKLSKAIDDGSLAGLKGLGAKKIESIKSGIALRLTASQRIGLSQALEVAESIIVKLKTLPQVLDVQFAGSLRRRRETIGDLDLVCAAKAEGDGAEISKAFTLFPNVKTILGQGTTKASVVLGSGLQVDLRIVPRDNFGAAMLYFTGSKDHNVKLRGLAQDKKMTLNEWGLYKVDQYDKTEKPPGKPPAIKPVASKTEADVYEALDLEFVEPELREDRGEVELAKQHKLPKLITSKDIRGDLHTHTTASDGIATIQEMAEAAAALGYEYLAITDHSKSSVIANGLTAERLIKHVAEIRKHSDRHGIKLLAGCEVDILVDGRLDFDEAVLKELDFVVASPHVSLKQDEAKATARILRAIESRYVNVIGHPTGRKINARAGLPLNFPKIFKAAAESGTALEINAGWPRLDLDDINARGAMAAGVMLSINTDAHATVEFTQLHFGLSVARRAGAEKSNVINCMSFDKLQKFIAKKR